MSITDELREYFGKSKGTFTDYVLSIADRIDVEHERQMAERRRSCVFYDAERNYCKVHDEGDMAELGYVRLPVDGEAPSKQLAEWIERRGLVTGPLDADGELWHSGDMSDSNWGVIESIAFANGRWLIRGHDMSAPWVPADSIRHYHAPTVEDVLTEFGIDWEHESDCEDRAALLKEYAKRLTLIEGEDA